MARHALLIGVSEFADERLARLNAPTNDVMALRGILQDSSRGNFDSVEVSLNEDFLAVRDHLSDFFHNRGPDDVLVLYYSGHGILGRGNRLFLATNDSNLDTPRARSVAAQEIRDFIEDSRAQRQIVVLDCCHSGAFAEHAKTATPRRRLRRLPFRAVMPGSTS
jgi:branched-chain amino acid transport system substrate-binding protein